MKARTPVPLMPPPPVLPATLARRIGLLLILLFGAQALVLALRQVPGAQDGFFLCLYVHVWVSIYDGSFSKLRTWSWASLILGWFGASLAGFLGYVLPIGQFISTPVWLAWHSGLASYCPSVPALVLAVDLVIMYGTGWREWNRWLFRRDYLLPSAAIALGATLAWLADTSPPEADNRLTPLSIVPEWFNLPYYAILRWPPNKLASVMLMLAAMIVPLITPWLGTARCRCGPERKPFQLLCVLLALCWMLLGYLGALPPTGWMAWAAGILSVFYFGFFLLAMPLLRWRASANLAKAEVQMADTFE